MNNYEKYDFLHLTLEAITYQNDPGPYNLHYGWNTEERWHFFQSHNTHQNGIFRLKVCEQTPDLSEPKGS